MMKCLTELKNAFIINIINLNFIIIAKDYHVLLYPLHQPAP